MEYFTYEMDVFKFERISHYDLYFKPSVPPMPDVAFRAKCKMFSHHLQKPILKTEKGRFKGL